MPTLFGGTYTVSEVRVHENLKEIVELFAFSSFCQKKPKSYR